MKKLFLLFFLSGFISVQAQSERKIPNDSLPASAKANIAEKFKDYKIAKVTIDNTCNVGPHYKVELRKDVSTDKTLIYYLVYDPIGKLISKKKDKEIYYSTAPDDIDRHGDTKNNPFPR